MVASNDTWTEILDNSPSSGPEVAVHCPDAIYYFLLSEAQGRRQLLDVPASQTMTIKIDPLLEKPPYMLDRPVYFWVPFL